MVTAAPPAQSQPRTERNRLAILASVKLTVVLMSSIALTVLIGAWCPQEAQVGQEKVVEMFGPETALTLSRWGVTDIFHTPFFLVLIGLLTVNMIACSFQRVFPKIRNLRQPMPILRGEAVGKLPFSQSVNLSLAPEAALDNLKKRLERSGYKVRQEGCGLVAEFGKVGRLAATVTHIGLLTLLAGVTVTSWTGFSGFQPVPVGGSLSFSQSEHSKLWVGKLPEWRVEVDDSRREDYESGDPKQWYSDLTVIESDGVTAKKQQISVNNPLSYKGVDIYQSSWALDSIVLSFNGHKRRLELQEMGRANAAFLPLDASTVLIFSVRGQNQPLRVFGKMPDWEAPKMITQIPLGGTARLGAVEVKYEKIIPMTGLQYKCDPGLPITFVAFGFIICGVMLAAVPFRQVWAAAEGVDAKVNKDEESESGSRIDCMLVVGGRSHKAKAAFEKGLRHILQGLTVEAGVSA